MSNKTKALILALLILAAILFGYGLYKVNQLAKTVNCLYILDYKMINELGCNK